MSQPALACVERYFQALAAGDSDGVLECVTDHVAHHESDGEVTVGKAALAEHLTARQRHFSERIEALQIWLDESGTRAAAEFVIHGAYRVRAEGLPPAHGQRYVSPAGAFFTLEGDRIARISTHFHHTHWLAQVEGRVEA